MYGEVGPTKVMKLLGKRSLEKVARPERFELPTYWFEASHSIQLS